MTGDEFRAAVFCTNQDEYRQAHEALVQVRPDDVAAFSGVVEGWLTPTLADGLLAHGLVVQTIETPSLPTSGQPAGEYPTSVIEDLKQETQYVALKGESGGLEV